MSLYFYEPFFTVSDFQRIFDDAFSGATPAHDDRRVATKGEESGTTTNKKTDVSFRPVMDLHENPEENLVTATFELPGLKKEDVSIDLQNNRLVISGETTFSKESNEEGYIVKQRRRGKFSRVLPLPEGTQVDQIKASMENGVLTVAFPKASPERAAKKITIS